MNATQSFCLASRGDLVRGRWAPGGAGPAVVLGAPDGSAAHPWIDSRFAAWAEAATLVAPDLPLCGSRTSEKLSQHGLDAGHALGARIRGDLEIQFAADLGAIRTLVGGAGPIAFVGCGPWEAWFRAACERAGGFAPVLVAAEPGEAWHEDVLRQLKRV